MRFRQSTVLIALFAFVCAAAAAQDIRLNVTYVCNGERIYIESCNIRDTSDTSTCMVAHPDHLTPSGMNSYTNMTRAALRQLLPTCKQPTAQQLAAQDAFQKRQQAIIDAQTPHYAAPAAATQQSTGASYGNIPPPKDPEERAMRRCVSSGRLPSSCTGNALLGMFSGMISSTLSSLTGGPNPATAPPVAKPVMSGVFQGAGNWRLDFIDDGVLVNCAFLAPNQESYSLSLASNRATLTIKTTPRPLVLEVHSDGTIIGPPGPVTIDGVVAGGSSGGGYTPGHTETSQTTTHEIVNQSQAGAYNQSDLTYQGNGTYDAATTTTHTTTTPGTYSAPQTSFVPRRATCPAIRLTSKGSGVGVQTMETNLLKSAFGGDTGPATPPGIRMTGIFASASTGFSVQFFPESAILGCGPDAARAYPYTVVADGTKALVTVDAPDKPLTLAFRADGSLDPGSGAYQVHGRVVTGQNANDDFTFAPMERSCNLALLTASKDIPSGGGAAALAVASAGLSTPDKPLGNATLAIGSSLPGTPNPLAGHPFVLLRETYANSLAQASVTLPSGTSPYVFVGQSCAPQPRTAACQNILAAINSSAASAARADATGNASLPGVPPGTYYLMISAVINGHPVVWDQAVTLHAGANSLTLTAASSHPIQ